MIVLLDLDGEPRAVVRLLRHLLRRLLRDGGVRCTSIRELPPQSAAPTADAMQARQGERP